ncbi:hypothetical protein AGOR_G00209240 [Albula goreensis]|uniref:Myb/SANT-like DNA-binding domain-containing protein n=1 Tax=Albula goreensis TaxID=1534307 RepID=A0A8T3CPP4_9TELE|nr:hypothetical protein AGOR_G00209240 [Albula goreensis]
MSGRGRNWEDEETKALLVIWSDSKIQRKLGGMRNAAAYRDISGRLAVMGFCRSADQVRRKVKLMRCEFKKSTDHNIRSGSSGKMCRFYRELSNILSSTPDTNVRQGFESPAPASSTSSPESSFIIKEEPTSDGEQDVKNVNEPSTRVDSSNILGNVSSSDVSSQGPATTSTPSTTTGKARKKQCEGAVCEVLNQLVDFDAKFLKLQQEKFAFEQEMRKQELEFQRQELEYHKELTNILSKLAAKLDQP